VDRWRGESTRRGHSYAARARSRGAISNGNPATPRVLGRIYHADVVEVNGELAVMIRADNTVMAVLSMAEDTRGVTEIRVMGNPDKLKWVSGNKTENGAVTQ